MTFNRSYKVKPLTFRTAVAVLAIASSLLFVPAADAGPDQVGFARLKGFTFSKGQVTSAQKALLDKAAKKNDTYAKVECTAYLSKKSTSANMATARSWAKTACKYVSNKYHFAQGTLMGANGGVIVYKSVKNCGECYIHYTNTVEVVFYLDRMVYFVSNGPEDMPPPAARTSTTPVIPCRSRL